MEDTQLLKGILEGCVLSIIAKGETYGYEIMQVLSQAGIDNLQEGTLYPILSRLEKKKYIQCRKVKSPLGPIRKYFTITSEGTEWLRSFKESYKNITVIANNLLDEDVPPT